MKMDKSRYCPQCGAPVDKGSSTCQYCGTTLVDDNKNVQVEIDAENGKKVIIRLDGDNQPDKQTITKEQAENTRRVVKWVVWIIIITTVIPLVFTLIPVIIGGIAAGLGIATSTNPNLINTVLDCMGAKPANQQVTVKQSTVLPENPSTTSDAYSDSLKCKVNLSVIEAGERVYFAQHHKYTSDTLDLKKVLTTNAIFTCPSNGRPYNLIGTKTYYRISCFKHNIRLESTKK